MTSTDKVLYELHGAVAVITMNRPTALNALDREAFLGLAEAFVQFVEDKSAEVAVLIGAGERAFCVGLDLHERSQSGARGLGFPDISPLENPFWPGRESKTLKPIIAAVNGFAVGGGFYMALQADFCIATPSAQFEISEALRGGVAGWEVGFLNALPYSAWTEIALGSRLSAQRAYDVGIVQQIVDADQLLPAALARAESILRVPPTVRRRNLELVRMLKPKIPDEIWRRESEFIEEARAHPDAVEAMAAFFEKRAPRWSR